MFNLQTVLLFWRPKRVPALDVRLQQKLITYRATDMLLPHESRMLTFPIELRALEMVPARATDDTKACDMWHAPYAPCSKPHATCSMQQASYNMQQALLVVHARATDYAKVILPGA